MRRREVHKRHVVTSFGRIAVMEAGDPTLPAVLLVHGIPTSSYLWRHVVRLLEDRFHCIAPDLMGLGDTEVDPETVPLHMESQAEMLAELMTTLGRDRYALVAHDQGGAAAQILATRLPDRLWALVLTDCVCYDNWPVPAVARLQALARLPLLSDLMARSGITEWMETSTPWSRFRRGVTRPDRLDDEAIREYLRPLQSTRAGRERFRRFLLAGHPHYTQLAVQGLRSLTVPTLIAWAADDAYISPSWGKKLFEDIPGARRFELAAFCGHFWPEERPAELGAAIRRFLMEEVAGAVRIEPVVTVPDPAPPEVIQ